MLGLAIRRKKKQNNEMDLKLIRDPETMLTPEEQMLQRYNRIRQAYKNARGKSDFYLNRAFDIAPRHNVSDSMEKSMIADERAEFLKYAKQKAFDEGKRYKYFKEEGKDYMPGNPSLWDQIWLNYKPE